MGFDEGRIILDSDNGAYYAGQTVYGRIVFDQGKPKTIHGIYVSFKGFCKVHWTTTEERRVNDRTIHDTIVHESYEEYFNRKTFVIGDNDGEQHLQAGHHEFRFDCPLPSNIPSSFEGSVGHIRYRVKVVMVTCGMFSSNKEKMAAIRVHAPMDLNQNPYCKEPIEFELIKSYCCWCVSAGSSEITAKLPVGGYCAGQVIPIEVSVTNHSSVEIDELKFAIKKDLKYEATSRVGTKYEHDTVAEIKKGPIAGGTVRNWTIEMTVPSMDVYNLNACRFIDVDYYFKVSTEVSGCHEGSEESHRIIFGTIPLVGFQDNVPNPLQDQLPSIIPQNVPGVNYYPPPPIVNQPLPTPTYPNSNYPQNTPYPAGPPTVTPYPGNQPFTPPYPNPNQPYPNTSSPYSNPAAPYPNTTPFSPGYPGSPNQPYPGNDPAPPYPGNTVPPYPGGNTASPYPGSGPNVTNSGLLKTGNFGFVQAGDHSSAPLLPSGANVPYPASPFPNPTAPAPSTPGSEKPSELSSSYPAYNRPGCRRDMARYPGGNTASPYPGSGPNVTNSGLLKTGNFGFVQAGDPSSAPLLPSEPSELSSPYPAYNPDFVNSSQEKEKPN